MLSPHDVLVMCIACVQRVGESLHARGTTSLNNHRPAYKNSAPVYKPAVYTPGSVQTSLSKQPAYAPLFKPFYRLVLEVIPNIHRAYIYDKKFKLINI